MVWVNDSVSRAVPYKDVKVYGAIGDGIADDTTVIQAAIDSLSSTGGTVFFPKGQYKQTAALTVPSYVTLMGEGPKSILICNSDIEQIVSTRGESLGVQEIQIRDLKLADTRTIDGVNLRTKYQVRITNGVRCILSKVETITTNPLGQLGTANVAGVHFERLGGTQNCFMNDLENCWIREGSVVIDSSDSRVMGGFVWSFNFGFAIKINAPNVRVLGTDVIPSPINGGIWSPAANELIVIQGCFFDGSYSSLTTGDAIYGALSHSTIQGNTFWNGSKSGINLYFSSGVSIAGNVFHNMNRANAGHSDILLKPGAALWCVGNTITGNTHFNNQTTSNKAYCFEESNATQAGGCYRNIYKDNVCESWSSTGYTNYISAASRTDAAAYERSLIGPNIGVSQYNSGTGTVVVTATTGTVTHGLQVVPLAEEISVMPIDANIGARGWWISSITSTTFVINVSSAITGSNANFQWSIRIGE